MLLLLKGLDIPAGRTAHTGCSNCSGGSCVPSAAKRSAAQLCPGLTAVVQAEQSRRLRGLHQHGTGSQQPGLTRAGCLRALSWSHD